jgi:acyl-coenzyme A synthetase/AMP-(fatty) acid ligase
VALPDPRAEHRLVPVFEENVPPEVMAAAMAAYQQQAPGFRRLQEPVRVPALPRSPLGKIRRRELAEWLDEILGTPG